MADDNMVMLLTDFRDLGDHESVIDLFDQSEFPDVKKTNVIMTCNWLLGREAQTDVGEEEGITIPPSAALAGKIYNPETPISQPIAGKEYGTLAGVDGVRFKLLQEHIGQMDQRGLVPMVKEFGGVMNSGMSSLSLEMNKAGSAVAGQLKEGVSALQQFDQQRLMNFGAMMAGSFFFLVLALWVGLPTLALAPSKFAICFTIGSALNMGAFAALRGPMAQAQHMIHKDRLPFSAAYVSSMLATLYASMYAHSYILTVIFSAAQVMCLGYYLASYFPGGVAGLKVVSHVLSATLGPILKATGRCFGVSKLERVCLQPKSLQPVTHE